MNRYAEMRQRQQAEFEQFAEGMAKLGMTPDDTDKIYTSPGGGFYRREDSPRLKAMIDRFDWELFEAIADDTTGDGFIYEMFLHELENHEYGYTGDANSALDELGYTIDDISADKRLSHGLAKAKRTILREQSA